MKRFVFPSLFVLAISASGAIADDGKMATEVKCYFDAVAAKSAQGLGDCMSDDAVILDVSRPIEGRAAVIAWAEREVIGGVYEVLEVTDIANGQSVLLTFAPGGVGGFKARYDFTVKDGKIESMLLRYA